MPSMGAMRPGKIEVDLGGFNGSLSAFDLSFGGRYRGLRR